MPIILKFVLNKYDTRIINKYGFCSNESIGYLFHLKKKYQIKDNPKIVNYIHTPNVSWAMINTKMINKNSNKLILLNYPGPKISLDLNKDGELFEFKDAEFFSDKFEEIESIEFINNSKKFEEIYWKLDILTIGKTRKEKISKTYSIKDSLENSLKIKLNFPFRNIDLGGQKLYFKINNINIHKYEDLNLKIVLKNKYILSNFQIINKIDNCYYLR